MTSNPAPISQEVRLGRAIAALRAERPGDTKGPLDAAKRSRFAGRVLAEKWFRRTFTMQRFAWSPTWRGDEITVLHELAHYVMPRETWAIPRSKGEAWVRRETCWSFLLLVQHKLGRDAGKALRAAFVANGVKYRPRRIMTAAQKQALKARMFKPKKRVLAKAATVPGRRKISFHGRVTTAAPAKMPGPVVV